MENKITTDAFEANVEEVLEELKELFYFSPPGKIREHLMEMFFTYLIELDAKDYPNNHRDIVEDYYFLYLFLNKMDNINQHKSKEKI
jgi:hypothetical protein